MAYKTTASLDKLTCTDYVDFGKRQDRFGRFCWSKNDSNYLDVKLKVFDEDDNKEFRLVRNVSLGEADFNQFMRLRNKLVNAKNRVFISLVGPSEAGKSQVLYNWLKIGTLQPKFDKIYLFYQHSQPFYDVIRRETQTLVFAKCVNFKSLIR